MLRVTFGRRSAVTGGWGNRQRLTMH